MTAPTVPSTHQLPPGYAEENSSHPLLTTCIAFVVLETIFMMLLYISRFLCNNDDKSSEQKANWNMVGLMTGAYFVCMGKITLGFRNSLPSTPLTQH